VLGPDGWGCGARRSPDSSERRARNSVVNSVNSAENPATRPVSGRFRSNLTGFPMDSVSCKDLKSGVVTLQGGVSQMIWVKSGLNGDLRVCKALRGAELSETRPPRGASFPRVSAVECR
jgi:hypothetical protein